jgi:hypothetical protein
LYSSSVNPSHGSKTVKTVTGEFPMWLRKAESRTAAPADEPALVCAEAGFTQAFHYWRGASGQRYLHSVYSLLGCPALPSANYILVRRQDDGSRTPIAFGQTKAGAISLNLAHLRHQGAKLGANEVHIHLLAETPADRARVEQDLSTAHCGRLAAVAA